MKKNIARLLLPSYFLVLIFSINVLSFAGPPVSQSDFRARDAWNVRWQFQPGTELVFDALEMESPYYERLCNSTVTGISSTTLHPSLEFLDSRNRIAFRIKVNGVSHTPTKSVTRPAVVFSDSELTFHAALQYAFGDAGWQRHASSASGHLVNRNIRIRLNNGLLPNVKRNLIMAGFKRSAETLRLRGLQKLQNELHAEMAGNLNELLSALNNAQGKDARGKSGAEPTAAITGFRCHSDWRGAYGTFCFGTPRNETAKLPEAAGFLFDQYPLAVAFEQSVFEQAMQIRLGGKTVPLDRLPEYMFSDPDADEHAAEHADERGNEATGEGDESCYVLLNREKPFELIVSDGRVTLVIHADQFEQSQKTYPGMDIEITYRVPTDDAATDVAAAALLVLEGPVRVEPKDDDGGSGRSLRTITIRRWLLNFFDRDLPKQVTRDGLISADEDRSFAKIGQFFIAADSVVLEDGWFALGCRLISR